MTHTTAPRPILNKDGTRVVLVGGELGNSVPAYAVLDLNHRLNGMPVGNGDRLATGNLGLTPVRADLSRAPVQLLWDGEIRMTLDCYHDLFIALSAAVMLILDVYKRQELRCLEAPNGTRNTGSFRNILRRISCPAG